MLTPKVTPVNHHGPSPHAPLPVKVSPVKRRWSLAIVQGHAFPVQQHAALKPETFVQW